MTVIIRYETADGADTIKRGEWHNDKDGFVTAFYNPDDEPGLFEVVSIPVHRVVTIKDDNNVQ